MKSAPEQMYIQRHTHGEKFLVNDCPTQSSPSKIVYKQHCQWLIAVAQPPNYCIRRQFVHCFLFAFLFLLPLLLLFLLFSCTCDEKNTSFTRRKFGKYSNISFLFGRNWFIAYTRYEYELFIDKSHTIKCENENNQEDERSGSEENPKSKRVLLEITHICVAHSGTCVIEVEVFDYTYYGGVNEWANERMVKRTNQWQS